MEVTTFLWMFVVLKIPIVAALVLIWYAIREPEPVVDEDSRRRRLRPHARPAHPAGRARRAAARTASPRPAAPPRTRTGAVARRRSVR